MKFCAAASDSSEDSAVLRAIKGLETKLSTVDDLKKEMIDLKEQVSYLKKRSQNNGKQTFQSRTNPNDGRESQVQELNRNDHEARPFNLQTRREHQWTRKCLSCHENNNHECEHCYKCGSSEHYARGCRKGSENRRGLSSRGR